MTATKRARGGSGDVVRSRRPASGGSGDWFVYVARCNDGSLYTGVARDVAARIARHDAGKGARYTRGRGPLTLAATWRCGSKGEALRLEIAVKRLPKARKEELIARAALQTIQRVGKPGLRV